MFLATLIEEAEERIRRLESRREPQARFFNLAIAGPRGVLA
jgi:hypothetical protein